MNERRNWWNWIGMAICLNAAVALADDVEPPKTKADGTEEARNISIAIDGKVQQLVVGEGSPVAPNVTAFALAEVTQSKYWIGLMCSEPNEAMRTQLDLATDVGLLVEDVSEGSPAMKAGMQRHDLVLTATILTKGEPEVRRLANLADLIKVVQTAENRSMKLEFLRRGRKQSLDLLPEERPQMKFNFINVSSDSVTLDSQFAFAQGNALGIWAGPVIMKAALPDGMTMEFQPAEGQPEKVTVKKGDQTWVAEIKALDKLPAEIAALVQQQLAVRTARVVRTTSAAHASNPAGLVVLGDTVHVTGRGDVRIGASLPEDVTVTVVRKGADPAKITLKKGDQTWDVTDRELDKLPVEVRPYAETVLRGHGAHLQHARTIQVQTAPVAGPWGTPVTGTPIGLKPEIVTKYVPQPAHTIKPTVSSTSRSTIRPIEAEELARQLKELTEQVEKLKQAVEKSQPK